MKILIPIFIIFVAPIFAFTESDFIYRCHAQVLAHETNGLQQILESAILEYNIEIGSINYNNDDDTATFSISAESYNLDDARNTATNLFPSVFGMGFESEESGCSQRKK
ncbi:MAG: hypothetical protein H6622_15160 [Halobacteriovoraceae bacterium]|nr:hypothetical protein [Halobacteriovoraceae bacterium]